MRYNIGVRELIYRLKRYWHLIKTGLWEGQRAQKRTNYPEKKLKIITVTGTDGKTTSSSLIYHLLKEAGYKVGLISTVAAYIGNKEIDTGFHVTSPGPAQLYGFMKQMVAKKIEYLVLETTSQGIYQLRTWGIVPEVAAITNLDYEHLDYHVTPENYWRAKLEIVGKSRIAVINQDMKQREFAEEELKKVQDRRNGLPKILYYGAEIKFPRALEATIEKCFLQDFNQINARLALTTVAAIGVDFRGRSEIEKMVRALKNFKMPRGRMETVKNDLGLKLIVDFAHTPQGLRAALENIRTENQEEIKAGAKLISIYGCAGLRDRIKRPVMGRIGAELSDIAIFTAEDPRTENIWSIINQMKGDLGDYYGKVVTVINRREAIEFALTKLAKKGDIIAIFGKGHEQSMNYGEGEELWNDIDYLEKRVKEEQKRD